MKRSLKSPTNQEPPEKLLPAAVQGMSLPVVGISGHTGSSSLRPAPVPQRFPRTGKGRTVPAARAAATGPGPGPAAS